MSTEPRRPVRPRFGRVPGFGKRFQIEPGACPTCGAYPPCDPAEAVSDPNTELCRSVHCPDAEWPHPYNSATCPKL